MYIFMSVSISDIAPNIGEHNYKEILPSLHLNPIFNTCVCVGGCVRAYVYFFLVFAPLNS